MQKSSNQLNNGNKEESENTQKDIINDLDELNNDMQDAFDSAMDSNLDAKAIDKLKDIKKSIEQLSKDQQELKDKTGDTKKNDKEGLNNSAKEQNDLQNRLNQDINDVMELSQSGIPISPDLGKEFGNAYNSMDKAKNDLGKGERDDATGNQGKAKTSLDNAAKMLGDLIGNLEKQGMKGKGKNGDKEGRMGQLMKRLSELIGKQQGVNNEMQQFGENGKKGNNGKGGQEELTPEQKIKLDKLKLEQQNISKSLDELNAEFEKEKENTGEKVLGDLNEVNKEIKEVIKDLDEYKVDEDLLQKQNRILSRMLEAQLSQREKDFEQKRESKPGEDVVRNSPPEIILSGPKSFNAFKEDFLKLQKQGYTEEYEALITKYLMEIKK
jgi:DNA repair exonuclease SbcCD ATPase subunit